MNATSERGYSEPQGAYPPPQGPPIPILYEKRPTDWPRILEYASAIFFLTTLICIILVALISKYLDRGEYNPLDVLVLAAWALLLWITPRLAAISITLFLASCAVRFFRSKTDASDMQRRSERWDGNPAKYGMDDVIPDG